MYGPLAFVVASSTDAFFVFVVGLLFTPEASKKHSAPPGSLNLFRLLSVPAECKSFS